MKNEHDWHKVWEENTINFHQLSVNSFLKNHLDQFDLKICKKILVPLCGKSLDLIFLKDQGFEVFGIEMSKLAIEQFFIENNLKYEIKGNAYYSENIVIHHCNFFEFKSDVKFNYCYDRASMIAIHPENRMIYVQKLVELLSKKAKILLCSYELLSGEDFMEGPPFSLSEKQINDCFKKFKVNLLEENIVVSSSAKFQHLEDPRIVQKVYLLNNSDKSL